MTNTQAQAKYDEILAAEQGVRIARTVFELQLAGVPDFVRARQYRSLTTAQARLDAALAALTLEEMREFGSYRAQALSTTK